MQKNIESSKKGSAVQVIDKKEVPTTAHVVSRREENGWKVATWSDGTVSLSHDQDDDNFWTKP